MKICLVMWLFVVVAFLKSNWVVFSWDWKFIEEKRKAWVVYGSQAGS
jgi:hypothetical protein